MRRHLHIFMKTKELALGVQVCNSVAQALRLQEESPIDILLIGSGYPQEERQKYGQKVCLF